MTRGTTAWLLLLCFPLLQALNCSSPTPDALFAALEQEVFSRNLLRPVRSFSHSMDISIDVTVSGILGVDEQVQSLTTLLWQVLEWDIEGLSWDEKECGTKRVSIPRDKLWIPDVRIAEFMDEDNSPETSYVHLSNSGRVFDGKPVRVVSSCRLEIYTFPFDIQRCSLTFGSYLHFAREMKMIQSSPAADVLDRSRSWIKTQGEWELTGIEAAETTRETDIGSYSEITYQVVLKRRPLLYVVNLLIPSCFLITVDLFSFMLPPDSVDRSSFKMTLILGYTVFLLIMNDLLPVTGETTPLINVFFCISLALMVASLLETVFITNIQFSSSQYGPVPNWVAVLVLKYIAIVVCLPPKKDNRITVSIHPPTQAVIASIISSKALQSDAPPEKPLLDVNLDELRKLSRDLTAIRLQMDKHFQGGEASQDWQMVGTVIDRLLFCLYIVFISASFITIICIWILNNV
ncbi:5-hydroxytryptamine receptor 3C-like [Clinocottus analis]|uniref:5-hydroxytryptamine receptor 3C-like n=1 Tax=Clinocottus analis TaxID=304258 RepID=UPI0035BF3F3B